MANNNRFYKDQTAKNADPKNAYLKIDSINFKRPMKISVMDFGKILDLGINADMASKNVSAKMFLGQDEDPNKPPDDIETCDSVNIAIDDNYLYIWVPSSKKWKRIMLGDWPEADLPNPE